MNERGVALPMALLTLLLLTALMLAFTTLSTTEPVIAGNQLHASQARAMAESGVERALWALSNPTSPDGLPDPLPARIPAAYDGTTFTQVGPNGGYIVTVAPGAQENERVVTAVGFVPSHANPTAIRKIQTTVARLRHLDPPCTLCAGAEAPPRTTTDIQIGGSGTINTDTSGRSRATFCADQAPPTTAVMSQGSLTLQGAARITPPPGGTESMTFQPPSAFTGITFSDADVAMLKAIAKRNGTYFQGSQQWTSANGPSDALKNGLVFVDTPSGNPLTNDSPTSDLITVDIHGNTEWSGWLIVAGSLNISGNIRLSGLFYAQNDATVSGNGGGSVDGALITTNRVDTVSSSADSTGFGNETLTYNCPAVRDGLGTIPQNWFVKQGTFLEIAGR